MDDRPMPSEPRNLAVFHIFATRVRTEMLRLRAREEITESKSKILSGRFRCGRKNCARPLREVEELTNRLRAENVYLQNEIKVEHNFEEIIGNSPALNAVLGASGAGRRHECDRADSGRDRHGERALRSRHSPLK